MWKLLQSAEIKSNKIFTLAVRNSGFTSRNVRTQIDMNWLSGHRHVCQFGKRFTVPSFVARKIRFCYVNVKLRFLYEKNIGYVEFLSYARSRRKPLFYLQDRRLTVIFGVMSKAMFLFKDNSIRYKISKWKKNSENKLRRSSFTNEKRSIENEKKKRKTNSCGLSTEVLRVWNRTIYTKNVNNNHPKAADINRAAFEADPLIFKGCTDLHVRYIPTRRDPFFRFIFKNIFQRSNPDDGPAVRKLLHECKQAFLPTAEGG